MIKHVTVAIAALSAPITVLSGCANQSADDASTSTSGSSPGAQTMTTQLKTVDGEPVADASIDFSGGYATVTVETVGSGILSPGFHGLHIHEVGTCEGDFSSAGEHFQAPGQTDQPASGDLPALLVRSDGAGKLVATSDGFTEDQLKDPDGSAIVLHQDASDQRIACGVLSPASATSTSVSTSTSTSTVTTTVVPPETPPATTVTETTSPAPAETSTTVVPETSTSTATVIQPPQIPDITVPPLPGPEGG